MLIRMGVNWGLHLAAGVATAGLALLAAEGWRRAAEAGNGPKMAGGRRDDEVPRHDFAEEPGGPGGPGNMGGPAAPGTGPAGSGPENAGGGTAL
jgi:hypothetical protein